MALELLVQIISIISDVDSVLLRMTIIGVLLSFRQLAQEALEDVSLTNVITVIKTVNITTCTITPLHHRSVLEMKI